MADSAPAEESKTVSAEALKNGDRPTWSAIGKVAAWAIGIVVLVAGGTIGTSLALAKGAGSEGSLKAEVAVELATDAGKKSDEAISRANEAMKAHREHEQFMKVEFQQFKADMHADLENRFSQVQKSLDRIEQNQRDGGRARVVNAIGH